MIQKTLLIFFCFTFSLLPSQNADFRILRSINSGNLPAWDNAMKGVSETVYPIAIAAPLATWAHGYFKKDKVMIRNGYKSAVTIGIAMCLSTSLKYLIKRERPFDTYPNEIIMRDHSGTYSFPSGHTTAAFATATSLSLSYRKWYVVIPAYTYAGFMGYSRMRLGMHYPSDVLGGILAGVGSGLLTWKLDKWIFGR